ncbi:hypothetical protein SLEP1_g51473 [Rubroshorea leprosula]|uniref:Uncharacterized protein n=1 Tax=Rubroshorea leprosula TaxID=152421 RepID=A0AAV5M4U1_9ROSI|nr:hypothetical protein SLEP1_g51473 [Rubroshorea leprosula]
MEYFKSRVKKDWSDSESDDDVSSSEQKLILRMRMLVEKVMMKVILLRKVSRDRILIKIIKEET